MAASSCRFALSWMYIVPSGAAGVLASGIPLRLLLKVARALFFLGVARTLFRRWFLCKPGRAVAGRGEAARTAGESG